MMSRSSPCSALRRRAFARISRTPIDAVSSMKIRAWVSVDIASVSFGQSRSPRNPVRRRWLSIAASDVSMRRNNCSFDISRLKKPTVIAFFVPTYCAMFSTRLVLPIAGLAATMIRSDGWSPAIISSSSLKPVGTPVMSCFRACACSTAAKLALARSPIATNPPWIDPSAILKMSRSASSITVSASSSAAYAVTRTRLAVWISSRSVDFCLTMRAYSLTLMPCGRPSTSDAM